MVKDKMSAVNDYNADSIKALEGLEAVEKDLLCILVILIAQD